MYDSVKITLNNELANKEDILKQLADKDELNYKLNKEIENLSSTVQVQYLMFHIMHSFLI